MKKLQFARFVATLFFTSLFCIASCDKNTAISGEGRLVIHFDALPETKSGIPLPDTSDFFLKISESKGDIIFDGKFGDCPESILVNSGTYYVSVLSAKFDKPDFDVPLYGDEQCVIVPPDASVEVRLACSQQNSGIRLHFSDNILSDYSDAVFFVKSVEGRLMYSVTEKRIAYFMPGEVAVQMSRTDKATTLFSKTLKKKEIVDIDIIAPEVSVGQIGTITIDVDTSRVWTDEDVYIGGNGDNGKSIDKAMNISMARNNVGAQKVWVYGYITGAFKSSSSKLTMLAPFPSETNIAIGGRRKVEGKEDCISVELRKGKLRDNLNLVSNPDNIGRKIWIKGDIVGSYFGICGLKNVTDFKIE